MFTHLAVRLILVVPDQLLPNRVVHLDGQGGDGHPVQSSLHAVELEGLPGLQAHAAVRELELESDLPAPLRQQGPVLNVLAPQVQILESGGGRPRLNGGIRRHHLHVLNGVVGGVGVVKVGGSVAAPEHPNECVGLLKGQGQQAARPSQRGQILRKGLPVVPGDGVHHGIAVGVPDDGVGGDGHTVRRIAGPDGHPHPVHDLRLCGGPAKDGGEHLPRRGEGDGGPHPHGHQQGGRHAHGHGAADGAHLPAPPALSRRQAVHHGVLLLTGKMQLIQRLTIGFHANPSCSRCVRSFSLPRLSWVATVAGFSPSSWAISLAEYPS